MSYRENGRTDIQDDRIKCSGEHLINKQMNSRANVFYSALLPAHSFLTLLTLKSFTPVTYLTELILGYLLTDARSYYLGPSW